MIDSTNILCPVNQDLLYYQLKFELHPHCHVVKPKSKQFHLPTENESMFMNSIRRISNELYFERLNQHQHYIKFDKFEKNRAKLRSLTVFLLPKRWQKKDFFVYLEDKSDLSNVLHHLDNQHDCLICIDVRRHEDDHNVKRHVNLFHHS